MSRIFGLFLIVGTLFILFKDFQKILKNPDIDRALETAGVKTEDPLKKQVRQVKSFALTFMILSGLCLAFGSLSDKNQSITTLQTSTTLLEDTPIDPFEEAMNMAMNAEELKRVAKSKNDWNTVASKLQEAIDSMKSVRKSNSNYVVARKKLNEYQDSLSIVKKKIATVAKQEELLQIELIDRIGKQYGYRPQIIEWGKKRTLTVPDLAWSSLSRREKELLMDYAKSPDGWQIITGGVKNATTIYMDQAVVGGS